MHTSGSKARPTLTVPDTDAELAPSDAAIVLFDGVCNLCNAGVDFVIKRDPLGRIKFAALQSSAGAELLEANQLSRSPLDTFVLIEGGRAYVRSTAILRIARMLTAPWPVCYVFILIPAPLRDFFYKLMARSRYGLFGQRETCRVPTPAEEQRFLRG